LLGCVLIATAATPRSGTRTAAWFAPGVRPFDPLPHRSPPSAFAVPDADCKAQQVRLALDARSASEQLITGSIWYDQLQIVRAP